MEIRKKLMSYGRSPFGSPRSPNGKKSSLSTLAGSPRSLSPTSGSSPVQSLKRYKSLFTKKSIRSPESGGHPKVEAESTDEAAESSGSVSNRRSRDEIRELTEVFGCFDADGDGKISVAELKGVLGSLGEDLCEEEVRAMIDEVDSDGDGCIDLEDFIRLNTRIIVGFDAESDLREAFRLFDLDKSGCITPKDLHRIMGRLGEDSSLDECHLMIKQVDFDGDGVVNFREFKHMMTATY